MTDDPHSGQTTETPLESWKEIAAYLQRDVSTAIRWEKKEGLPVRRHHHHSRASVYAFPSELDAWRNGRRPEEEQVASREPVWRRFAPKLAVAAMVALAVWVVSQGPILNPPDPLAEAADAGEAMNVRQVWFGPEVDVLGNLSANGRLLSYVHWDTGDLAVRDLSKGENRRLTQKGRWGQNDQFAHISVFSPDCTRIAFVWWNAKGGRYELRVIGVEAEAEPTLVFASNEVSWPEPLDWFPDGKRILAALTGSDRSNRLAIISLEDQSVPPLLSMDWNAIGPAKLSPDGRWIAVTIRSSPDDSQTDIALLAVDGSRKVPIIDHPAHDDVLAWTPNGGKILFRSDRSGGEDLWMVPVENGVRSGEAQLVKAGFDVARPLGFAAGGDFYFGARTGDANVYIAAVDFETGKMVAKPAVSAKRFTGKNLWPAWSADGRYLAYISRRRNRQYRGELLPTLVIRDVQSGTERDLETGLERLGRPNWSPDGSQLLVGGTDAKGRFGIYRVAVNTGNVSLVAHGGDSQFARPQWHLGGNKVFYRSDGSVRLHDLSSGMEKDLYEGYDASLSPDGEQMIAVEADRKAGIRRLVLRDVTGKQLRRLVEVTEPQVLGAVAEWTADGSRIVFWRTDRDSSESVLWSIRPDGNGLVRTDLEVKDLHQRFDISIHPDGKQVAYSAGKTQFEVWALENFLSEMRAEK